MAAAPAPAGPSGRQAALSCALARLVAAEDTPRLGWDCSMQIGDAALALERAGELELAAEASRLAACHIAGPGSLTHRVRQMLLEEIWS